jgi:hypothetical protein
MTQRKMTPKMQSTWWKAVARSWGDDAYKQRLIENPKDVLAEEGLSVPDDTVLIVHENKPGEQHLVIPESPGAEIDLTEVPTHEYNPGF